MNQTEHGLTVSEASKRLGIGERAILYKIQQGSINAKKIGRSWLIYNLEEIIRPLSNRSHQIKRDEPKKNKEKNFNSKNTAYDFRRLAPYSKLQRWLDHPHLKDHKTLLQDIHQAMGQLAMGFYQWDRREKLRFYQRARDHLALVLHQVEMASFTQGGLKDELFHDLHHDVMGSLIALSKSVEKGIKT